MPKLTMMSDAETVTVEVADGLTILEAAHEHGLNLEGACEGCMACATCHVIVDEAWFNRLTPATPEEEDMLDLAAGVTKTSRLGCQITLGEETDGIIVRLPPGEKLRR